MWFDTIPWLVAIVAFIAVEAATTALCVGVVRGGAAAAMAASFSTLASAGRRLFCRRIGHYAGADDSHSCQPPR